MTTEAPTAPLYTDLQQVFNHIWQRFVVEGAPQSVGGGYPNCRYAGPNDSACFVGVCVPDKAMRAKWDATGGILSIQSSHNSDYHAIFNGIEAMRLVELQSIHDGYCGGKEGFAVYCRYKLSEYATKHNLTVPT